ncbi:MAG: VPLPA-CTERM sorting domain-containing protein [Pseudomonadota bacterium]
MHTLLTATASAAAIAVSSSIATAAPVTFFGEDISGSGPNAAAAEADFLSNLSGVSTEDFESATLPNVGFAASTGVIGATLAGGGAALQNTPAQGRSATSGTRFVETQTGGGFGITFDRGIAAFGFYGTDIGDFGNSLLLQLTTSGGGTVLLDVGNTTAVTDAETDGSLLYFGFIDDSETYTSVEFLNTGPGADAFGFDDLTVGDLGQVLIPDPDPGPDENPGPDTDPVPDIAPVPLPASFPLLLLGLGGMFAMRRLRNRS